MVTYRPLLALFGGPTDTGNLGVSALGESTLASIAERRPEAQMLVFDNGRGRRLGSMGKWSYARDGAWISRRLHRDESLWSMATSARLGVPPNRNVAALRRAQGVLDVSGGDSFTDLYGSKRWQLVTLPKKITLQLGRPLILLPQTYGPYSNLARRRTAADIVARARSAWSRDRDGLEAMKELLGARFDAARHREGVDVAFALPARKPALPDEVLSWVRPPAGGSAVTVGLNVSGLLMNDPSRASAQFGLTVNYPRLMHEVARRLLANAADRLLLVPHVRGGSDESDDRACARLAADLDEPSRVRILPSGLDASETKWCIQGLDWLCGTRMHATIAALSSGVPAAAVAYSSKTQGVFETASMGHAVVDARSLDDDDALNLLLECAGSASNDRERLRPHARWLRRRASEQFAEILDSVDTEGAG